MIYGAYQARRTLLAPLHAGADLGIELLGGASGWGVPGPVAKVGQAALGTFSLLELTHERPDFRVDYVVRDGEELEVWEEAVASTPFGTLLRFATSDQTERPKVLIVPGLAGHFATLVRNTISTMLIDHDVYVTDWRNARDVPVEAGPFGLDDYIEHIIDFLDAMGPDSHVVAVCQPCPSVVAAASIMAEDDHPAVPRSLVLLAGPVDASINPGPVNEFATKYPVGKLERLAITEVSWPHAGAGRRVYPGFLQIAGFLGMSPRRHLSAFGGYFNDLARHHELEAARTQDFYEEYFAVLDIAAEFYLDTTRVVFQDFDLARGRMTWRGRAVDPSAFSGALFTIEGEKDEFCPPGQTEAAHDLCTSVPKRSRKHLLQEGVGHYGVFSGSRFENEIYPRVRDFIAAAVPAASKAPA